ncbi:aquaporin-like protein [Coleophoma crateriformis]|uniref:Aquaporin-like protein n=1 Tax=Coleophoma crateriformis TaxID=565419 RepID=A0A3D8SZ06_9HELO|nr:aquaporin-like protein [Coleophoma crateriformis]
MSGDGAELPIYYGSKTSDGELVKRPTNSPEALVLSSPSRAYTQGGRGYSPERTPVDATYTEATGPPGLRRRPSTQPSRRLSMGDYEDNRKASMTSNRPRDDAFYRDDDRDYRSRRDEFERHPDTYERSRPPRTYRNANYDQPRSSSQKPYYDETLVDRQTSRESSQPAWIGGDKRRAADEESIDGYNYDQHKKKIDIHNLTPEERKEVLRLPWIQWMNSDLKNHFVATIGEFVGTTMFLFFAFSGTQVANIGSTASNDNSSTSNTTTGGSTGFNIAVYLYISVIFGFSLMVNVWVFFRISGGLFNPAVTLGMVLVGAIPPVRAIFLLFAQVAGGIAASGMVLGLFPTQFNVRTTLSAETSLVQGVFIEAILTAELVFTIFMLAKEKHKATFIAPVGIGLALFIAEMCAVFYTGGSLNPARSFGPCVVTWTWDHEHWIYWVGPIIGSLIAVFFYKFIKMLEYEMANPGQDGDDVNNPMKNEQKRREIEEEARQQRIRRIHTHHNRG